MQPEPCDDPNSCSLRKVSQVVRLAYVLRACKAQKGRFTFRKSSPTNKTGEKRRPFLSLERMNNRPPRSGLKPPLWNMRPVSSPNACLLSRERIPSPPTIANTIRFAGKIIAFATLPRRSTVCVSAAGMRGLSVESCMKRARTWPQTMCLGRIQLAWIEMVGQARGTVIWTPF